jgi:hypothetical protein
LKGAVPCGVAKGLKKGFSPAVAIVIIITENRINRVFFINISIYLWEIDLKQRYIIFLKRSKLTANNQQLTANS